MLLPLQVIDPLGITRTSRMNSFNALPTWLCVVSERLFASGKYIISDRSQLKPLQSLSLNPREETPLL